MSHDQTAKQTHDTRNGSSPTDSKLRLKKKEPKIQEVEAIVTPDGKIKYDDGGEEKDFYPADHNSYQVAIQMCQDGGVEAMEVELEFFKRITHGKPTPYLLTGNPPVKVFPKGSMERGLKIEKLSVAKLQDLLAKKAREEAEKKKKAEDEITSL